MAKEEKRFKTEPNTVLHLEVQKRRIRQIKLGRNGQCRNGKKGKQESEVFHKPSGGHHSKEAVSHQMTLIS